MIEKKYYKSVEIPWLLSKASWIADLATVDNKSSQVHDAVFEAVTQNIKSSALTRLTKNATPPDKINQPVRHFVHASVLPWVNQSENYFLTYLTI